MNPTAEFEFPAAMKELIQYFETHGRLLDRQDLSDGPATAMATSVSAGSFVSCIKFNGVPILPPVMTGSRREEARQARHDAVFREKRLKARHENTQGAGARPGRGPASRLPLERPSVLKPVATSAWASVTSAGEASSIQCNESSETGSVMAASSLGNTFATAEQAHEDFGLQTLDSVCSDFMSLEETLPTDFGGVPLTSVKQQKISHDLLRLSKILKVGDFNSTGGSDMSEIPVAGSASNIQLGEPRLVERAKPGNTATLDNVSASFFQDTVVEVTTENATENTTSGFIDNASGDGSPAETSSQGEGNLSGVGSSNTSGMSSANTTATSESQRSNRSSPRSLKNTVHFASFVTEYIDTSASLSSENITVVKKKMSAEYDGGGVQTVDMERTVVSTSASGSKLSAPNQSGDGLLGKVSLSEPDFPEASMSNHAQLPFQSYSKADPSTSDKENDSKQANKMSGRLESASRSHPTNEAKDSRGGKDTGGNRDSVASAMKSDSDRGVSDSQFTLKSEESSVRHRPGAAASTGVSDSQGSSRSDTTAATSSSSSTLIEDTTATNKDSANLPLNIVEPNTEESGSAPKEKQQTAARKPKKLPPEPPQAARHATRPNRGANVLQQAKESSEQGSRGLVRSGSYTLLAPSPALIHAQILTGDVCMAAGGDSNRQVQRKLHYDDDDEDHTKPLNILTAIATDPESAGKAEHISRYLSQVQLHSSDDVTGSQLSADLDGFNPEASTHLHDSYNILHSLLCSQASLKSDGGGEVLQEFENLRQNLLQQQQKELEELFIQQRREQMLLQQEIEEHHKRMKDHQDFLITNAPENIKVKSHTHDGELSPDSNSGEETNIKKFNFPPPKQTGIGVSQVSSGAGARVLSPSTLMFSTSSSTSPKVKRPVLRSPVKFYPGRKPTGRVITPPEAYEPGMKEKFYRLTAAAKGFLTRRLLNSDKVQGLVKTIRDTREFAFSFQAETPIKKGNYSTQDRNLLERIVAQLQAALLDVHEIFFETPILEQMALLEQTRLNSRERLFKSSTDESVRGSGPRISAATLKALERKKKAQEAEAAVFGAAGMRPRTAPPATSSPRSQSAVDLSGPLKRHYQFLLSKALKPAAMYTHHAQLQVSPIRADNTARSDKSRPQTAPEKSASSRPKKPVTTTVSAGSGHASEPNQSKPTMRPKQLLQQLQQPALLAAKSSKTAKPAKSWR